MIRVLLVDDIAIVRRGIASLLGEADGFEVVGEAGDGREAIAKAEELRPDVVCLDVRRHRVTDVWVVLNPDKLRHWNRAG